MLVRQTERSREELHVGGGLAAHVSEVVEEPGRDSVALIELDGSDMVLALEVVDVFVLRVEALGRTLERLAADGELAQEVGGLRGALPLAGVGGDGVSYLGERRGVGMPDADASEDLPGARCR